MASVPDPNLWLKRLQTTLNAARMCEMKTVPMYPDDLEKAIVQAEREPEDADKRFEAALELARPKLRAMTCKWCRARVLRPKDGSHYFGSEEHPCDARDEEILSALRDSWKGAGQ